MSFGPAPSLVGTLFTSANNSALVYDPSLPSDTCDCNSNDDPGDGGNCKDGSSPSPGGGEVHGGAQPPQMYPHQLDSARPNMIGAVYPPCYNGYRVMGTNPTAPPCQNAPTPGVPPGCVTLATRIALFPEGCKVAAEVQPGDLLLTRRTDGTLAGERVHSLRVSTQPCVLLETEDGRQLHCSLSHEVMVADPTVPQGRRTLVTELTLEDRLLTEDGTPVALMAMTRQPDGQVLLISLVGPEHIYLSDGLWSHNATKGIPAWPIAPL